MDSQSQSSGSFVRVPLQGCRSLFQEEAEERGDSCGCPPAPFRVSPGSSGERSQPEPAPPTGSSVSGVVASSKGNIFFIAKC